MAPPELRQERLCYYITLFGMMQGSVANLEIKRETKGTSGIARISRVSTAR
jgi:hypothetical protein